MRERWQTEEGVLTQSVSNLRHNLGQRVRTTAANISIPLGTVGVALTDHYYSGGPFSPSQSWAITLGVGIGAVELLSGCAAAAQDHIKLTAQRKALAGDIGYLKELAPEQSIDTLLQRAAMLPPGGAKVMHPTYHQGHHIRLIPTLLHETSTGQITGVVRSIAQERSDESVVVQLTTAGRHKDGFKRAAMNMQLAHPYEESWGTPFFEAPWGGLAPLIHDGGAQNVQINRNWQYAHGRTDYLFRLPAEAGRAPHQATLDAYIASRARFYQRASFAAHCYHEVTNGPEHQTVFLVPRDIKEAGAAAWQDYSTLSDRELFGKYDLKQMVNSNDENRWFLPSDTGTNLTDYGPRYEADDTHSFFHLSAIEEVKRTHGLETVKRAAACMDYLSDSVDDMLGLPISSRDSRFCASD